MQAVLANAGKVPDGAQEIRGWDFDEGSSLDGIMGAMLTSGIQATALGRAINEINRMVSGVPIASAFTHSHTQQQPQQDFVLPVVQGMKDLNCAFFKSLYLIIACIFPDPPLAFKQREGRH